MSEPPLHSQLVTLNIDPSINERLKNIEKLSFADIDQLKNEIELELNKNFTLLSDQNVTMESQLVTDDGFPRSDIDVLQVRIVRRNINMLKNDLTKVLDVCYTRLQDHFKVSNQTNESVPVNNKFEHTIPFASIQKIAVNSPIQKAGCLDNDEILLIGDLHAGNYLNLQNISKCIAQNENKRIILRIKRNKNEILELFLIPHTNWGGRGMLGCRLKLL